MEEKVVVTAQKSMFFGVILCSLGREDHAKNPKLLWDHRNHAYQNPLGEVRNSEGHEMKPNIFTATKQCT